MPTREQGRSQRAYERVNLRGSGEGAGDYKSFAKRFPTLIHSCGLAQALAFAQAKKKNEYLQDLAYVLLGSDGGVDQMTSDSRTQPLAIYQRHTLESISSATWLKRYAEALLEGED